MKTFMYVLLALIIGYIIYSIYTAIKVEKIIEQPDVVIVPAPTPEPIIDEIVQERR